MEHAPFKQLTALKASLKTLRRVSCVALQLLVNTPTHQTLQFSGRFRKEPCLQGSWIACTTFHKVPEPFSIVLRSDLKGEPALCSAVRAKKTSLDLISTRSLWCQMDTSKGKLIVTSMVNLLKCIHVNYCPPVLSVPLDRPARKQYPEAHRSSANSNFSSSLPTTG